MRYSYRKNQFYQVVVTSTAGPQSYRGYFHRFSSGNPEFTKLPSGGGGIVLVCREEDIVEIWIAIPTILETPENALQCECAEIKAIDTESRPDSIEMRVSGFIEWKPVDLNTIERDKYFLFAYRSIGYAWQYRVGKYEPNYRGWVIDIAGDSIDPAPSFYAELPNPPADTTRNCAYPGQSQHGPAH
jgi:hypothetical protein